MFEGLDFSFTKPQNRGILMGFDPGTYENIQETLSTVRQSVDALQQNIGSETTLQKANADWKGVKSTLAEKHENQRLATVAKADAALDAHNNLVEEKFRRYVPEPILEAKTAPSDGPAFSGFGNGSFNSMWAQKAEQPKPEKKSWFRRLFGKKVATPETIVQPPVPVKPKEKDLPSWARVALRKASQVDDVMLREVKANARAMGKRVFSTPPESNSSNPGTAPKPAHEALPKAAPQAAANVPVAIWHTPEKRSLFGTLKEAVSTLWGDIKGLFGKK